MGTREYIYFICFVRVKANKYIAQEPPGFAGYNKQSRLLWGIWVSSLNPTCAMKGLVLKASYSPWERFLEWGAFP